MKKIRVRVTGIGGQVGPIGGSLEWEYLESNYEVARSVLIDLESRRVLWQQLGREDPVACVMSAQEIRRLMTERLPAVKHGDDFDSALRAIRRAATEFVSAAGQNRDFGNHIGTFVEHLEAMRFAMAPHIAALAFAFGIPLEPELREILPRQDLSFVPGFD
ncbi:DUF6650 family protein [Kribbella sp. NPDC049227]|uniref:DUF6650 family protein n=1 Tax=Kribbella sp. NPDC049227 TaxID=3364113 RepID=UPI0037115F61